MSAFASISIREESARHLWIDSGGKGSRVGCPLLPHLLCKSVSAVLDKSHSCVVIADVLLGDIVLGSVLQHGLHSIELSEERISLRQKLLLDSFSIV